MKKSIVFSLIGFAVVFISFKANQSSNLYIDKYNERLNYFKQSQYTLLELVGSTDLTVASNREKVKNEIKKNRIQLKGLDFWFRYLEPTVYKKVNGPLPVEWETEVFEKFEKPYKREGAGLTLAEIYLDEQTIDAAELKRLIKLSYESLATYSADSITINLKKQDHFFLCNRLYLLNLAAIYTTGFECPDTSNVIVELQSMMKSVKEIYSVYGESFPSYKLTNDYIFLYENAIAYVEGQPKEYSSFDHFTFIKEYINPLYILNQKMIKDYNVVSRSMIDYSLNKNANSIFSKSLYNGQNAKGLFIRVNDTELLNEIKAVGKKLFYDPILSGNNKRSCASCHRSGEYFTDTTAISSLQFDNMKLLPRNTPSLVNVEYNHLLMLDGKHITLNHQGKDVIINPIELGANEQDVLKKVLSCSEYKIAFKKFLKFTPQEKEITIEHITSALSIYYTTFSNYYSPFDNAMNKTVSIDKSAKEGFNLFMSKAQCATCHFVPQFNGVKPPYIGSEFEVLGVPFDTNFSRISDDKGRYLVNPAEETLNAFRTGTVRNADKTKPYMHNGVFNSLMEVIDFYDAGGGLGRGLEVKNQTLSSDSLHLSISEKNKLIAFIKSVTEEIPTESIPDHLPVSTIKALNNRKVGGEY